MKKLLMIAALFAVGSQAEAMKMRQRDETRLGTAKNPHKLKIGDSFYLPYNDRNDTTTVTPKGHYRKNKSKYGRSSYTVLKNGAIKVTNVIHYQIGLKALDKVINSSMVVHQSFAVPNYVDIIKITPGFFTLEKQNNTTFYQSNGTTGTVDVSLQYNKNADQGISYIEGEKMGVGKVYKTTLKITCAQGNCVDNRKEFTIKQSQWIGKANTKPVLDAAGSKIATITKSTANNFDEYNNNQQTQYQTPAYNITPHDVGKGTYTIDAITQSQYGYNKQKQRVYFEVKKAPKNASHGSWEDISRELNMNGGSYGPGMDEGGPYSGSGVYDGSGEEPSLATLKQKKTTPKSVKKVMRRVAKKRK